MPEGRIVRRAGVKIPAKSFGHGTTTVKDLADNDAVASDETVRKVVETHAPICVAADGLSVIDDVGGIPGYLDFLTSVFDENLSEESEDLLMWAKERGWKNKLGSPKILL